MNDTTYQIFQDGETYKVRITRLGHFIQEADGFTSCLDAASWVAQAERLGAVRAEQQKPTSSPYLRVVSLLEDVAYDDCTSERRRDGMSGPTPGSMDESPAVTCLRHYGSLEAATEALKAVSGRVALDEPGELTEVASLKAEVARLTEENQVLREQVSKR